MSDQGILVGIPGARTALDRLKMETAHEIAAGHGADPGLQEYLQTGYGGNMKAKTAGAIGGHMVRTLIETAEELLAAEMQPRPGQRVH